MSAHPAEQGLNLHAVMALDTLPKAVHEALAQAIDLAPYRQLHLFGHGGQRMWQALQASGFASHAEPVDAFAADVVSRWFAGQGVRHRLLFPFGECSLPLQQLGELAGWHHRSPFMIGVNAQWGSWYAYRAVALADSDMAPTAKAQWAAACTTCVEQPCITACPAAALEDEAGRLERCIDYRLQAGSPCSHQCLARAACPVGSEHRYADAQIHYHYGRSLATIRAWRQP